MAARSRQARSVLRAVRYGITRPIHLSRATSLPYDSVRHIVGRQVQAGNLARTGFGRYALTEQGWHAVMDQPGPGSIAEVAR